MTNPIDLLEVLLSITEQFCGEMNNEELKLWQQISAKTADLRLGSEDV